jgi:hypothetical protein
MSNRTGQAFEDTRTLINEMIDQQGLGKSSEALQALNAQYANYMGAVSAAKKTAAKRNSGMFSPQEGLDAWSQQATKSGHGTALLEGRLPDQRIMEDAVNVLGRNVPDSGTAGRLMVSGMLMGGATPVAPGALTAAIAANGIANTPAGRKFMVGKLFKHQRAVAEGLRNTSSTSGKIGASLFSGAYANKQANRNQEQ